MVGVVSRFAFSLRSGEKEADPLGASCCYMHDTLTRMALCIGHPDHMATGSHRSAPGSGLCHDSTVYLDAYPLDIRVHPKGAGARA